MLDEKSRQSGTMGVGVWFWDDYVTDLNRYNDLQHHYYNTVIQVHSSEDQDQLFLDLYAEAFSRPAFQVAFFPRAPS